MQNNKKWKHLRVLENTHKRVKALAVFKDIGIDEVINYLLDKEISQNNKNAKQLNYRKREF